MEPGARHTEAMTAFVAFHEVGQISNFNMPSIILMLHYTYKIDEVF